MAHYAFLDNNNIVIEVIAGIDEDNTDELPEGFDSWEAWYGDVRGQTCIRTSYNTYGNSNNFDGTPFSGNYAGIDFTYDVVEDVVYAPQPFDSWTLTSDWIWEAPIEYPDDGESYIWNENAYNGDNTKGWELLNE